MSVFVRALALALVSVTSFGEVSADTLRVATYNVELSRRGPGLLLADIQKSNAQVAAVAAVIAEIQPDVLLLTGFDYDLDLVALGAFADALKTGGVVYPHLFARRPNTGMATGLDMDGDGRLGDAGDAQGWGRFAGADGMAILSRYPVIADQARDFTTMLWRDLPGTELPVRDGKPFPSAEAQAVQRLSTTSHWDVPIDVPDGAIHLLAFYATPPVFDGPEDSNGLRNAAETGFWSAYLDGKLTVPGPAGSFVILGNANLDPVDGDGRGAAMRALLAHPLVQDPLPKSVGGSEAGAGSAHRGDPALDTADWPEVDGPGNLRADYVLPSADLTVTGSGVFWPAAGAPGADLVGVGVSSRHRLVWVDIDLP